MQSPRYPTELMLLVDVYTKASRQLKNHNGNDLRRKMLEHVKDTLDKKHLKKLIPWQKEGLPLEEIFKVGVIYNYFSSKFKFGNFAALREKYGHMLAIFCGYENYQDFKHRHTPYQDDTIKHALDKILPDYKPVEHTMPDHFIPDDYFENLEFGQSGIEINCISYSLFWAALFIPKRIEKILQYKNKYNYLLTESSGNTNKRNIEKLFKQHPELKNHIEIKTLYDKNICGELYYGNIAFPLFNDIVIYGKRNVENGLYEYHEAIIGTKPHQINLQKTPSENKIISGNFSIKIDDSRGIDLYSWFTDVWSKLDHI